MKLSLFCIEDMYCELSSFLIIVRQTSEEIYFEFSQEQATLLSTKNGCVNVDYSLVPKYTLKLVFQKII